MVCDVIGELYSIYILPNMVYKLDILIKIIQL